MLETLTGTTALITGGGRGLGRTIALAFGAAGASVAITGRSLDRLNETVAAIEGAGGRALALAGDVSVRADVERAVAATEERFGPIDVLINNAGVSDVDHVLAIDPDEWWRVFEVNVRGPMLYAHAVLRGMIARGRGRIINLASGVAFAPSPLSSAYASSKAAVLRLTDSLAQAVTGRGVAVFAISPGWVETAMGRDTVERLRRHGVEDAAIPWTAPERTADLCLAIAGGRLDALSGRLIHVAYDTERLLENAAQIEREGLYMLRFATLDGLSPLPPPIDVLELPL